MLDLAQGGTVPVQLAITGRRSQGTSMPLGRWEGEDGKQREVGGALREPPSSSLRAPDVEMQGGEG